MKDSDEKSEISFCDECGSIFLRSASKMEYLCPECSHILYGYENCKHEFINGRCSKCLWDGSSSYIRKIMHCSDPQAEGTAEKQCRSKEATRRNSRRNVF